MKQSTLSLVTTTMRLRTSQVVPSAGTSRRTNATRLKQPQSSLGRRVMLAIKMGNNSHSTSKMRGWSVPVLLSSRRNCRELKMVLRRVTPQVRCHRLRGSKAKGNNSNRWSRKGLLGAEIRVKHPAISRSQLKNRFNNHRYSQLLKTLTNIKTLRISTA